MRMEPIKLAVLFSGSLIGKMAKVWYEGDYMAGVSLLVNQKTLKRSG